MRTAVIASIVQVTEVPPFSRFLVAPACSWQSWIKAGLKRRKLSRTLVFYDSLQQISDLNRPEKLTALAAIGESVDRYRRSLD